MDLARIQAVARGQAEADLLLTNAKVVNVFTAETLDQEVAIADGVIAAVGERVPAQTKLDLGGRYLCPGLIDAHVHVESSMVAPFEMARAVVPRGTTTVVSDPHEIGNVAGLAGIRWMLDASEGLPLEVLVNAPSCVPATHMATAGAALDATALVTLLDHPRVVGLAEVMNVPGVVLGDAAVHRKLDAFRGRPIDGHAPAVPSGWLNAYCAAGVGSDHECISPDEAEDRLRLGMYVFLRESTGAKNLLDLLPAVTAECSHRCALCTDDRHPYDLLEEGHLDHLLRLAISHGLDPVTALRMVTINPAECFRLGDRGAIAPGRRADLLVCPDLQDFHPELVLSRGQVVAKDGAATDDWPSPTLDNDAVHRTLTVDPAGLELAVPAVSGPVRVIGVVPNQLITKHLTRKLPQRNGHIEADPEQDIVKMAVIERHRGTGNVGLGFVHGLGLARGALASTYAHDHHNLVVAGVDDQSMRTAVAAVVEMNGGFAVCQGEKVIETLPLPLGGLMSERPVGEVRDQLDRMLTVSRQLGCRAHDPFMVLGFLALEVIPALKLTDQGLVDVERFEIVPLAAG